MKKQTNENCILATDFSVVNQHMEQFMLEREKKGNIYIAINEYIGCLKDSLKSEDDLIRICKIEQEIKKLEKLKKEFYVPSILGESKLDLVREKENKVTLEKTSFALVKRMRERFAIDNELHKKR